MKKFKSFKNVKSMLNWTVFKSSKQFYKRVDTALTFTQSENVRRTTENMIKIELIDETQRDKVAAALTRLILSDEEIAANLRELAAGVARTYDNKTRIKNARALLKRAQIKA